MSDPVLKRTGKNAKYRTVKVVEKYDVGKLLKTQADTKGTGVVGRPAAIALESKRKVYPAKVDPTK